MRLKTKFRQSLSFIKTVIVAELLEWIATYQSTKLSSDNLQTQNTVLENLTRDLSTR